LSSEDNTVPVTLSDCATDFPSVAAAARFVNAASKNNAVKINDLENFFRKFSDKELPHAKLFCID
jgi:hypothetical protein